MDEREFATRQQKIDWLVKNKNLWLNYFENRLHDVKDELVERMKHDGIFAPSTNSNNVKLGKIVLEAKRIIDGSKDKQASKN